MIYNDASRTLSLCLLGLLASLTLARAEASGSELRRTAIVRAVEAARPSVVNIHGRKTVRAEAVTGAAGEDFRQVNGMGTGVVIDPRGYILTNHHVVDGVSRIQVTMHDRRTTIAELVAHDPKTDLAILKIDAEEPLPVLEIGVSSDLMNGEPVVAVGNAYGYEHTVTRGIISALYRTVQVSDDQIYDNLIQTDASINPGNSGGPLLNIDGEAVGINVAVRVGAQGIGFAIPIDDALRVAAELLSAEQLSGVRHGVVGRTYSEPSRREFVVRELEEDGPGEECGLMPGDVIRSIDSQEVERELDFQRALLSHASGDQVELTVDREGQTLNLTLTLATAAAPLASDGDRIWTTLGLRLAPMSDSEFRRLGSSYRGGLKVLAVRSSSPAARQGIRTGDVLVGMHKWETISPENVSYILKRPDFSSLQPMKFFIVRGSQTLYGHLRVAAVEK